MRPLEIKAFEDQAVRIEVGILLQEVDRVTKLGDRERLARISVDDAVAFHLEPLGWKVVEMGGVGEVHEDLVVKLAHMIDGFIERNVQHFAAAHCVVKRDTDEKGGFADAMAGDDDSDVPAAESAVDRVFEQSQRDFVR